MALKPHRGTWAPGRPAAHPRRRGPRPGLARRRAIPAAGRPCSADFRDGHTETWWAADASPGRLRTRRHPPAGRGHHRPGTLPDKATWYLATNLPRPGAPHDADSPHPPADLAEIVRLYGLRHWIEQSYKQVKDELGWADFQVRSDRAIRRHQTLVNCAFSFCWAACWFLNHPQTIVPHETIITGTVATTPERRGPFTASARPQDPRISWPKALDGRPSVAHT